MDGVGGPRADAGAARVGAPSPFQAAVLGAVFLGEVVTPCRLAGMALIAVAMLVAGPPRGLTPRHRQRLRRPRLPPCGNRGVFRRLQRTSASAGGAPALGDGAGRDNGGSEVERRGP